MSEDKSKIIELSSSKGGQKEATSAIVPTQQKQEDTMGSGQVILQPIPCDDLGKRLAMIYAMAIKRAELLAQEQNGGTMVENAKIATADNNDDLLTQDAKEQRKG